MPSDERSSPSGSEGPPALLRSVDPELLTTEGYLLEVVTSEFPFVSVLAQHLIKAGGKRLRVALTFLAAGFGDRDPARQTDIRKLAAAIELTHLATLHHDDIIDEADSRRGVPSVNANWTNTLAVLSGDYLFAKSSLLAAEVGGEVPRVLATTIAALCEGQVKEIEAAFKTDRRPEEYLEVIEYKTARLLSGAAYLGALVGGADREVAQRLDSYGTSFGMAYQLADDLLDFLGDEAKTGKPVGTDLKEGVYTLPVLHAMGQRDEVSSLLEDEADFTKLVDILHDTGSFDYAREVAVDYAAKARECVRALPEAEERDVLDALVDFVVDRVRITSAA